MNSRWLALGLTFAACIISVRAQDKMPVPVEDDTNAPSAMRGQTDQGPLPTNTPKPAAAPPEVSAPGTPYSEAIVAYKAGNYDQAYAAIEGIDPTGQDDNFVILESRILTELKHYDDGEKLLKTRLQTKEQSQPKPAELDDLLSALGDLFLHKRAFDRAAKFYGTVLKDKPNDPDLTLKLIYAHIGDNDLRTADQLASTFNPFDPKHPYDDHPVYYFARAALAQSIGHVQEAEDDLQDARTNYGVTVTNRYLKTYLHFFSTATHDAKSGIAPSAKP